MRPRVPREAKREICSARELARELDPAPVGLDDSLGDAEPEPGAAVMPRQRILDLEELLEDPAVVARIDADPRVADTEDHLSVPRHDDDLDAASVLGEL